MSEFASYKNKRVVITGCFSGMGEAAARLLLKLGAEVHGLDYKPSALPLASFHNTDLRDPTSIDAAVDSIGGKIDALFNCAGVPSTFAPIDIFKVNYIGPGRLPRRQPSPGRARSRPPRSSSRRPPTRTPWRSARSG